MDSRQASRIRKTSAGRRGVGESVSLAEHDSQRRVKVLGVKRLLPVVGTPIERIAAITRQQRGRVSRTQLLAAGLSKAPSVG